MGQAEFRVLCLRQLPTAAAVQLRHPPSGTDWTLGFREANGRWKVTEHHRHAAARRLPDPPDGLSDAVTVFALGRSARQFRGTGINLAGSIGGGLVGHCNSRQFVPREQADSTGASRAFASTAAAHAHGGPPVPDRRTNAPGQRRRLRRPAVGRTLGRTAGPAAAGRPAGAGGVRPDASESPARGPGVAGETPPDASGSPDATRGRGGSAAVTGSCPRRGRAWRRRPRRLAFTGRVRLRTTLVGFGAKVYW